MIETIELPSKELTYDKKFKLLNSVTDVEVVKYLVEKLNSIKINILGKDEGNIFDLMLKQKLEGWCWQTTETVILFLNDDDYIARGYLYLDKKTPNYYHSWICFKYNDKEYVFDPCLRILCSKRDYEELLSANVVGHVTAKEVRTELIHQLEEAKKKSLVTKKQSKLLESLLGSEYIEYEKKHEGEVVLNGPEDVSTPFYRNGAGYQAEVENDRVRKLSVHYYHSDC